MPHRLLNANVLRTLSQRDDSADIAFLLHLAHMRQQLFIAEKITNLLVASLVCTGLVCVPTYLFLELFALGGGCLWVMALHC